MPSKKKSKAVMKCSPECLKNMEARLRSGKKDPERFTVTRATLDSAWSMYQGTPKALFGFVVAWETKSAGFGELTICMEKGKMRYDSEAMGRKFCKEVLAKLLDSATDVFEEANKRNARKG